MKPFHNVAIPHKDILEGRLTLNTFAADLWEVYNKRAGEEYNEPNTFFAKTYLTQGLSNLISVIEKRLAGKGGDPVIQLQTPFGGGKTHALIAMYHKAGELGAKRCVIAGTPLSGNETVWGLMEKQLTGKIEKCAGQTSPGRDIIRELLEEQQPVLILMDEFLEYVTKSAGVNVGESTLAGQTLAFMQELTEAVSTLHKTCLVVTLPSSIYEYYDIQAERAERLFRQLQKVTGRVEKIYTPVQDYEVNKIIRCRLFSDFDEEEARKIVNKFVKYAEKEGILPTGVLPSQYRERFLDSYPFMPEVVEILYHRWGSFSTFQRTRGLLRLLSLVIHSMVNSSKPYISLADFDLANQEIRQELLKHIGNEFNSVIASDISGEDSGSKKVDKLLGKAYIGLNLGTRTARTIFLCSFSAGPEKGITLDDIKRFATTPGNPSSVIVEAAEQLKGKLFYLQTYGDKFFFSNLPNLNRIRLTKMENVKDEEIQNAEKELLKDEIKVKDSLIKFISLWEENSNNIQDNEDFKVLILKQKNLELMKSILLNKGQMPRVYRNTLFFLYPLESERSIFVETLKSKIACEEIEKDETLNLSKEQKKENKKELKNAEEDVRETLRRLYRKIAVPHRPSRSMEDSKEAQSQDTKDDFFKEIDMGIPTHGEKKKLGERVLEKLLLEMEILKNLHPLVIKEKYLTNKEYVSTELMYKVALTTPGEPRPMNKTVLEKSIKEGVNQGLFGLGEFKEGNLICHYFKEPAGVSFSENEVIISKKVCEELRRKEEQIEELEQPVSPPSPPERLVPSGTDSKTMLGYESSINTPSRPIETNGMASIKLKFPLPKGKVSDIMRVINMLHTKFENIELQITATKGEISKQEYEDKIEEAFRQLGIRI